MQWTYEVRGVLPEYNPPFRQTSELASLRMLTDMSSTSRRRRTEGGPTNFVLDNLRMENTAASSPIKGGPLLLKKGSSKELSRHQTQSPSR